MILFIFSAQEQKHPSLSAAHDPRGPKQSFSHPGATRMKGCLWLWGKGELQWDIPCLPYSLNTQGQFGGGGRSRGTCVVVDYCAVGYKTPNCRRADTSFCCLGSSLFKVEFPDGCGQGMSGITSKLDAFLRSPVASLGLEAAVNKPLFNGGVHPDSDCCNSSDK